MKANGKVSIYACGGTGTSITSYFEKYRQKEVTPGFANITPYYIDTSKSDLNETLPVDSLYIFEDKDGSGKIRSENNEVIKKHVNDILHRFKPDDFSIIVSSAGGGSGAVIAGYLAIEMLKRNHPFIVITVGSTGSRIEIDNTIKTLKSLERFAVTNNKPIALSYWQNDKSSPQAEVDAGVRNLITRLSALFSRQHLRLDTTDLINWLDYTKVSNIEPKLVLLDCYDSNYLKGDLENDFDLISAATLCREGIDPSIDVPLEYQAVGYVSQENSQNIHLSEAQHFCIIDGVVPKIHRNLMKELEVYTSHRKAKAPSSRIISNDEIPENDSDDIFL